MNAPTVVFAYNRPKHLKQTLTALSENDGAENTEVFVFIDGAKTGQGLGVQKEVEATAKSFEKCFKSLLITSSAANKGLAKSVIGGVSNIINRYGRVIAVEDDAVSAPGFLRFMNDALDFYESDSSVWSVGGFTVPVDIPGDYTADVIKTQRSSSYAWATWKNRWDKIDWSVSDYRAFRKNHSQRRGFNRWGSDRANMLDCQMSGEVDSWAIRFDYAMFKNGMYNIVPSRSLIRTIGRDGSGTHSNAAAQNDPFAVEVDNAPQGVVPADIGVDERIRKSFCQPFKLPVKYRLKQYLLGCKKFENNG